MTDKEACKLIADRVDEMAKDDRVVEYVMRKFNSNVDEAIKHVYMMAVATLYGASKSEAK